MIPVPVFISLTKQTVGPDSDVLTRNRIQRNNSDSNLQDLLTLTESFFPDLACWNTIFSSVSLRLPLLMAPRTSQLMLGKSRNSIFNNPVSLLKQVWYCCCCSQYRWKQFLFIFYNGNAGKAHNNMCGGKNDKQPTKQCQLHIAINDATGHAVQNI